MKKIHSENAPKAIGPYSQAISYENLIFTSGQIPLCAKTGKVVGESIEEQAEQVMKNLDAVLKEAGTTFEKVIKTTSFLADMKDFEKFNEVYAKYFINKPARSCFSVNQLPKNVLCEVEVIALK